MGQAQDRRAFALEVVERLVEAGHEAVWAGGCVRDLLLGGDRVPDDYDIATDAIPDRVREIFGREFTHEVGAAFGVILVRGGGERPPIEVATFRTEGAYGDGRHPDSVQFASREEDARRRDFTINGMFMDPRTGEVFDDVGGRSDLEQQVVRAIGDPESRIDEDKLRMLRAIRFTASLGFTLDPDTASAIGEHAAEISLVSAERIAEEWRRMLGHPSRSEAVGLAIKTGLLGCVFPEIPAGADSVAVMRLERLPDSASAMVALAVLLVDVANPRLVCERFKLSNRERDEVAWLVSSRSALDGAPTQPRSQLFPVLADRSRDGLLELVDAIVRADGRESSEVAWCRGLLETVSDHELDPRPLVTGDDLLAIGLSPGPLFKTLLDSVRAAQLDREVRDRGEALAMVRDINARQHDDE